MTQWRFLLRVRTGANVTYSGNLQLYLVVLLYIFAHNDMCVVLSSSPTNDVEQKGQIKGISYKTYAVYLVQG